MVELDRHSVRCTGTERVMNLWIIKLNCRHEIARERKQRIRVLANVGGQRNGSVLYPEIGEFGCLIIFQPCCIDEHISTCN